MVEMTLFYILFLCQIVLFSGVFPYQIFRRMRFVISHFPHQQYPKLYPQPIENYHRFHSRYFWINAVILVLGIGLLIGSAVFNLNGQIADPEFVVWLYFMLQMLPIIVIELSEFSQFKLMREADKRRTRTASLNPRHLFDFVAPLWFGLTLFIYLAVTIYGFYLEDFKWDINGSAIWGMFILLGMNLFFAGIIYWNLYGKKLNPYLNESDRFKQISVAIRSLLFISATASLFYGVSVAIKFYEAYELAPLAMTLYLQIIAAFSLGSMLHGLKLEDMDFSVYQDDSEEKIA